MESWPKHLVHTPSEVECRVLLVDEHPVLRLGLRVLLERLPDMEVVGEAGDGEEALTLAERLRPDMLITECRLRVLGGPDLVQEIRRRGLSIKAVALSAYDDDRYLARMRAVGALGYLLKHEPPQAIVAAVRTAARGLPFWEEPQLVRVQRWQEEVEWRWSMLTEREREVLAWVAMGKGNKGIALEMGISEKTVEYHVSNILGKLGVGSRGEAIVWIQGAGLRSTVLQTGSQVKSGFSLVDGCPVWNRMEINRVGLER